MQGCEGVKEILIAREYGKKGEKEKCVCVYISLEVHYVERKKKSRDWEKEGKGGKETDLGLSRGSEHEV